MISEIQHGLISLAFDLFCFTDIDFRAPPAIGAQPSSLIGEADLLITPGFPGRPLSHSAEARRARKTRGKNKQGLCFVNQQR